MATRDDSGVELAVSELERSSKSLAAIAERLRGAASPEAADAVSQAIESVEVLSAELVSAEIAVIRTGADAPGSSDDAPSDS
jgi:hypothetical protein